MALNFAILSVIDDPLLGIFLEELNKLKITPKAVLLDSKGFGQNAHNSFNFRTNSLIKQISPYEISESKIPFYLVKNHCDKKSQNFIKDLEIDYVVSQSSPRILKKDILDAPKIGTIGCHPGILPDYKGCSCVEWALFNEDPVGNTTFFLNEGIDSGPIIEILKSNISIPKNYFEIRTQVYLDGIKLLAKTIKDLNENPLQPESLSETKAGTYYDTIPEEKLLIVVEKKY